MTTVFRRVLLALLGIALAACGIGEPVAGPPNERVDPDSTAAPAETSPPEVIAPDDTEEPAPDDTEEPAPDDEAADPPAGEAVAPPEWLGTRVLEEGPKGYAEAQPTPPELTDRRLITEDLLPPPPDGEFASTIDAVPDEVAARSTWVEACPVDLADLRYVTLSFWGFDDRPHTGELLVHASAAEDLVTVFADLFAARFPIEEMRVTRADELDAPPTGDGNNTGAFVCRPSRDSARWSEHAHGLAVDINPFHNPLVRGETILPELATAYADRGWDRPGMIQPGDDVVQAFAAIGWSWGGDWSSLVDYMHFSHNGR